MEPQQADQQIRQLAFNFACNAADGLVLWREQRQASTRRLGAELGYPLGEHCEVELQSGVILRGTWCWTVKTCFCQPYVSLPYCGSGNAYFPSERLTPAYASID